MKYYTDITNIDKIAGEMLNVSHGITLFDSNGKLLDKPKPNHNKYNINNIEYIYFPINGLIIINVSDDKKNSYFTNLIDKFNKKNQSIPPKYKRKMADIGTTQYMVINSNLDLNFKFLEVNKKLKDELYENSSSIKNNKQFIWYYSNSINNYLWIIKNQFKNKKDNYIISLSTIFCDQKNILTFPDNHSIPDFPELEDYTLSKNKKILNKEINICQYNLILPEIAILSSDIFKKLFDETLFDKNLIINVNTKDKIFWLRYEDIQCIDKYGIDVLREDLNELNYMDLTDIIPRCFITNVPIFYDCYVIDVYENVIYDIITENEFDSENKDIFIYNESAENKILPFIYNAHLIKKNKNTKPNNKIKHGVKAINARGRKKKITKANKTNEDDENKTNEDDENKIKEKSKKPLKEKFTGEERNVVLSDFKKYGTLLPKKQYSLKVKRIVRYDKPKHLFISPIVLHIINDGNLNNFLNLNFQTKFIMYRSYFNVDLNKLFDILEVEDIYRKLFTELLKEKLNKTANNIDTKSFTVSVKEDLKTTTNNIITDSFTLFNSVNTKYLEYLDSNKTNDKIIGKYKVIMW